MGFRLRGKQQAIAYSNERFQISTHAQTKAHSNNQADQIHASSECRSRQLRGKAGACWLFVGRLFADRVSRGGKVSFSCWRG